MGKPGRRWQILMSRKKSRLMVLACLLAVSAWLGACHPAANVDAALIPPAADAGGADDMGNPADHAGVDQATTSDARINDSSRSDSSRSDDIASDTDASGADSGTQADSALTQVDSSLDAGAIDASTVDSGEQGQCVDDNDCGSDRDCVGGLCREACVFTCLFAETGDVCLDGHCVDCESNADCPSSTDSCDPESFACIALSFRPDPVVPNCGVCPSGSLCGGGGDPSACGTPGFSDSWCSPGDSIPSNWSYLENGWVRVGADMRRGAAIGHFSSLTSDGNILDENDTGRYLQQSYYGDDKGGSWNGDPWAFNPVQGGDSDNVPSEVVDYCNDGSTLYAKTIPRDWGGLGVTPTVMEEWITLVADIAVIRFRFEYLGDWNNAARHQEVPAFFVRREFEHLTYYQGNAPWTGAGLTSILPNQLLTDGNQYINFNEPWLAYLNASDWGVGLYKRGEDNATCYRYQSIGDSSATSYFAMLDTFALTTGMVHDYTIYMKIGSGPELRSKFMQLYQAGL